MIATAAGVLTASLIGSVHCASMCGGFVCFYTGSGVSTTADTASQANSTGSSSHASKLATNDNSMLRAHVLYNGGRLLSYLLLGTIAGAIGSQVSNLGAFAGLQQTAAVVAALLMILWAISTLATQRGVRINALRAPESWQRALGSILYKVREQSPAIRALITGLLTTILPCGWLYVFVATAGGTGNVLSAMLLMFVFWLGTLPALVAVGLGAQKVFGRFRKQLPSVSAAIVLVMGLLSLMSHLQHANEGHFTTTSSQSSVDHAH